MSNSRLAGRGKPQSQIHSNHLAAVVTVMDGFNFDDMEDGLMEQGDDRGGDKATATAPQPSVAVSPKKKKAAAKDMLALEGLKGRSCMMCDKKQYQKSRFCNFHKKEAEVLKKDAIEAGYTEFYESQCSNGELYKKMLTEFMAKCASKGAGVKRDRFNWVQYKETAYKAREVRRGRSGQASAAFDSRAAFDV